MSVKANHEKLKVMLSQVEKMNIDENTIAELKVTATAPHENGAESSTTKTAGDKTGEDEEDEEGVADSAAVASNIPLPPPLPPILGELGPGQSRHRSLSSSLLSPLNRYTYPSSIARYGVTTEEAVRPKCSPTNAELGPYS